MEWGIVFIGSVGAGKTEAVRSISEIDILETDVAATDETAFLKKTTTVSMDVGVIHLGGNDKLRIYSAPGQDRFDFMWEILLQQVKGVILLLNQANADPIKDLAHYLRSLTTMLNGKKIPLVIGISHVDKNPDLPISVYFDYLEKNPVSFVRGPIPICHVDCRVKEDVQRLMFGIAAMLEVHERIVA